MTVRDARVKWVRLAALWALLALAVVSAGGQARAQAEKTDWVARASASSAATSGVEPAEKLLFPALLAMDSPPVPLDTPDQIRKAWVLTPKSTEWAKVAAWLTAEPQKKLLEALKTVTDPEKRHVVGIPYGTSGVDEAWVKAGLYVDIGPEKLLGAARYLYLPWMYRVTGVAGLEAMRLMADGKGQEALDVLMQALRFGRLLAERSSAVEMRQAMNQMVLALQRMCDLTYLDREKFKLADLQKLTDDLDERRVRVRRLRFPDFHFNAAFQVIERTTAERGAVDPNRFASTMALITSVGKPLTRFQEAGHWRALAPAQAGWFEIREKVEKVNGDFQSRWDRAEFYDPELLQPTELARTNQATYALLGPLFNDLQGMELARKSLVTFLGGTRSAMGVVAFRVDTGSWPPQRISSVQPKYVRRIDTDPFNVNREKRLYEIYQYFVPIRDQRTSDREEPKPHKMTVTVGGSELDGVAAPTQAAEMMSGGLPGLEGLAGGADGIPGFRTPSFDSLPPMPAGALKFENGRIAADPAALRGWLTEMAKGDPINPEDIEKQTADVKRLIESGAADDPGKDLQTSINAMSGEPMWKDMLGDDREKFIEFYKSTYTDYVKHPSMRAMIEKVRRNEPLTEADIRANRLGMVEVATEPKVVDSVTQIANGVLDRLSADRKPIAELLIGRLVTALSAARPKRPAGFTTFQTELGPDQFVVYSIGTNARPDMARNVGSGGTDILIYPAPISLYRKHLRIAY
ncbi:MAG: hypothetical protein IBJ11_09610 [Phycisphaerales bacterium]|nr:hypothetical protein [Phycisphaerales bacterium]